MGEKIEFTEINNGNAEYMVAPQLSYCRYSLFGEKSYANRPTHS
jgi:hypothetical protein